MSRAAGLRRRLRWVNKERDRVKINGLLLCACISGSVLLSSCGTGNEEVTDTSVPETDMSETGIQTEIVTTELSEIVISEEPVQTASSEDVMRLIDESERPEIIITDNSGFEEIMLAGKMAGEYYGRAAEEFFGFGIEYDWKNIGGEWLQIDGITGIAPYLVNSGYREFSGYYTDRDKDIFAPMDYEAAKQFIMARIGLTEKGFCELCQNSPSNYLGIDGALYINSGDGGQAGWSYSRITGYDMSENSVTYSCERVGDAEEWSYEEDIIAPFTFTLALEDGVWKLDGCSYGEGLFDLAGIESEIE